MSQPAPVHVLNGDALASHFPESLTGKQLVVREMLMEGPLKIEADAAFWQQRESYLQQNYPQVKLSYPNQVKPTFESLVTLPAESPVNLWFEHDLFCQVNFWFCCSLLVHRPKAKVFYVQPLPQNERWQGFGSHRSADLLEAYRQRKSLPQEWLQKLAALWQAYASDRGWELEQIAAGLKPAFPFLPEVAEAARDYKTGGPKQYLKQLLEKNPEMTFAELFASFNAAEGRLGMSDLQFGHLLERLK